MASENKLKSLSIGYYKYHNEVLGKGSFATVYLARHKVIGCEVALKVINTNEIKEDYVVQNLEREAHILKDLHHPNIIRLYETVKTDNLYCLSLELVRGVNLYQFLMKQETHRITERMARVFFYQMLSAVGYMHRLHIIHRDLKLENILVEFGHAIKIGDFGLSNIYYPCFRLRTHCGSVEYAAPELFRSNYGLAADLWSLGVILYVMVVGQMPFPFSRDKSGDFSRKREQFLQRITRGLMQENWELMEELSPECWNLLHDLLEPDQFRRIQIEDAIHHHWIKKDEHLRRKLPQSRKDLQRKFRSEIINYLADLLNTSNLRIENRINAGHYNNTVACMFYIIRDTLVKEVLYPPQNIQTSFLYRFDCWKKRKTSSCTVQNSNNRETVNEFKGTKAKGLLSSIKTLMQPSSFQTSGCKPSLNTENKKKVEEDPKSHFRKDSVKQDFIQGESINQELVISKNALTGDNNTDQDVHKNPYRSYRKSRPQSLKVNAAESKQNLPHPTHDVEKDSGVFFTQKTNNSSTPRQKLTSAKTKNEEKEYNKMPHKYSVLPNSHTLSRHNSGTYTKLETSTNKESRGINSNERRITIAKKASSSSDGVSCQKKRTEITNSIMMNRAPFRESISKRTDGDFTNWRTRKEHQPVDDVSETGGTKRVVHLKAPNKIPIKNMRYGPPAPSSPPFKTPKSKRTTVADRISLSRGDTYEKS